MYIFKCPECGNQTFKRRTYTLVRIEIKNQAGQFTQTELSTPTNNYWCEVCTKGFAEDTIAKHASSQRQEKM